MCVFFNAEPQKEGEIIFIFFLLLNSFCQNVFCLFARDRKK